MHLDTPIVYLTDGKEKETTLNTNDLFCREAKVSYKASHPSGECRSHMYVYARSRGVACPHV